MRNFLFRNVSLVDKTGRGEGKKKKKKRTRLDTETRSENQGETGQERGLFPADLPIPPYLSSMEERATRSYRFPINRSVEQILPRVLFRTLFRRVYSAIQYKMSGFTSLEHDLPFLAVSSSFHFFLRDGVAPPCPDLTPSPFVPANFEYFEINRGRKNGRPNLDEHLSFSLEEDLSFSRRMSLFRGGRSSGEWRFRNAPASGVISQDGETSWLSFGTIGIRAGISSRISRKYRSVSILNSRIGFSSFLFLSFILCVEIFSWK